MIFVEYADAAAQNGNRFRKIRNLCSQALADDLNFAWIDTCCIDKTNSVELAQPQEAMQSCLLLMMGWKWTGLSNVYLWITFIATTMPAYVMDKLPAWWFPQRTVWGTPFLSLVHDASRWTVMLGAGLATVYEMKTRGLFARREDRMLDRDDCGGQGKQMMGSPIIYPSFYS